MTTFTSKRDILKSIVTKICQKTNNSEIHKVKVKGFFLPLVNYHRVYLSRLYSMYTVINNVSFISPLLFSFSFLKFFLLKINPVLGEL